VLEVIHVASDVLVHRVVYLPLLSNAEVNEVTGVLHHELALSEKSGRYDTATFARDFHHLNSSSTHNQCS